LLKSLDGSGIGSLSQCDGLGADADRSIPGDRDGVFHALVGRTAFRMNSKRAFRRLACLRRHHEIVVDVNRFDPDRFADTGDAAIDSGLEGITIECDLAPWTP